MTDRLEYARQYRENNKEKIRALKLRRKDIDNENRRKRYAKKGTGRKGRKCQFCGILLTSQLAKKKQPRRYCGPCWEDPENQKHLRSLYMARWLAKKQGHSLPSLTLAEDIIA